MTLEMMSATTTPEDEGQASHAPEEALKKPELQSAHKRPV